MIRYPLSPYGDHVKGRWYFPDCAKYAGVHKKDPNCGDTRIHGTARVDKYLDENKYFRSALTRRVYLRQLQAADHWFSVAECKSNGFSPEVYGSPVNFRLISAEENADKGTMNPSQAAIRYKTKYGISDEQIKNVIEEEEYVWNSLLRTQLVVNAEYEIYNNFYDVNVENVAMHLYKMTKNQEWIRYILDSHSIEWNYRCDFMNIPNAPCKNKHSFWRQKCDRQYHYYESARIYRIQNTK